MQISISILVEFGAFMFCAEGIPLGVAKKIPAHQIAN